MPCYSYFISLQKGNVGLRLSFNQLFWLLNAHHIYALKKVKLKPCDVVVHFLRYFMEHLDNHTIMDNNIIEYVLKNLLFIRWLKYNYQKPRLHSCYNLKSCKHINNQESRTHKINGNIQIYIRLNVLITSWNPRS